MGINMKNKKNVVIICFLFLVLFLAVFFYTNDALKKSKVNTESAGNTASASWHDHYENVDELIKAADIIIHGKQIDSYTVQIVDMIFTKEVIEVEKVYQGDVLKGDKIEVIQTGGEMNNISTAPIEDAPLLEKNGGYFLALKKSTEGSYTILGGFQGVAEIQGNDKLKFNNENDEIALEFKNESFAEIEGTLADKIKLNNK